MSMEGRESCIEAWSPHNITPDSLFLPPRMQTLFQQARKSISHGEFTVVISCLRLIRHIHSLLPEYKAVLLGLESGPYGRFPRLLQQFEKLVSLFVSCLVIMFV